VEWPADQVRIVRSRRPASVAEGGRVSSDAGRDGAKLRLGERRGASSRVDRGQRGEDLLARHPPPSHGAGEGRERLVAAPLSYRVVEGWRRRALRCLAGVGPSRREPRWWRGERDLVGMAGGLPLVQATGAMPARRRDDVAAVAAHVKPGSEDAAPRRHGEFGMSEEEVAPPAAGEGRRGGQQGPMAGDQRLERFVSPVGWVDVEDEETAGRSGGDPDVRIRPARPPGPDHCLIDARVAGPVRRARMLAGRAPAVAAAGAAARADAVERQHRPALPRVVEGTLAERVAVAIRRHPTAPVARSRGVRGTWMRARPDPTRSGRSGEWHWMRSIPRDGLPSCSSMPSWGATAVPPDSSETEHSCNC
jgi:hypothetical protein